MKDRTIWLLCEDWTELSRRGSWQVQKWSGGRGGRKDVQDFKGLLQCEKRTNLEGKNSLGPTHMKTENPAIPCNNLVGTNESGGTNQLNVWSICFLVKSSSKQGLAVINILFCFWKLKVFF